MPCSLAVSITKAAVSNEQLLQLLTPEVVYEAVKNFLRRHETYQRMLVGEWQGGPHIMFYVGRCVVTIVNGEVTVTGGTKREAEFAQKLMTDVTTLLSRLADYLFAQQVQNALAALGPVESQAVNVDDQGVTRQATVLTLKI
ncbi:MAG TPA: hypothetical protein VFA10_27140 [Ktedonobacteraceae bacterium]|nr:hypothetical protein [Ktedonobacteraceae bacterium]